MKIPIRNHAVAECGGTHPLSTSESAARSQSGLHSENLV